LRSVRCRLQQQRWFRLCRILIPIFPERLV